MVRLARLLPKPRWSLFATATLAVVVFAPLAALAIAPGIETEGGGLSIAAVQFALAVSDRSVWEAARHSVIASVVVLALSAFFGFSLAIAVARRAFPGRALFLKLSMLPAIVPPLFGAVGCLAWIGGIDRWSDAARWLTLVFLGIVVGVPRVARAALEAWDRFDTTWDDVLRLEGAGRTHAWRWCWLPVARTRVAGALAEIWTIVLADPGAPYILGLKSTLGARILESAADPNSYPRAALLGLLSLALVLVVRAAFRRIGRVDWTYPSTTPHLTHRNLNRPVAFLAPAASVGLWIVAAWTPICGLVIASRALSASRNSSGGQNWWSAFAADPALAAVLTRSIILGSAVAVLLAICAAWLTSDSGGAGRWLTRVARAVPAAAWGTGMLMIPAILAWTGEHPPASRAGRGAAWLLGSISGRLGLQTLLVLTLTGLLLPTALAAFQARDQQARLCRVEAATTLGLGIRRARLRSLLSSFYRFHCLTLAGLALLAATESAASLILISPESRAFLAPGVLDFLNAPGGMRRAATACLAGAVFLMICNVRSIDKRLAVHPDGR